MKSVKQERLNILQGSDCSVLWELKDNYLRFFQIELSGAIAKIPSLKNQKIPGRNFISNKAQGHLRAMTDLYRFRTSGAQLSFPPETDVYCQVIIAQGSRVDEDNGYAAIKDWLEPPENRNWGIGIITDDKFVTGEARHCRRIDENFDRTLITVRLLSEVKKAVKDFTKIILNQSYNEK